MGKAVSAVASALTSKDGMNKEMEDAKAQMKLLMTMARKQEQIYTQKLLSYYTQDDQFKKYQIVGGRLVQQTSFISASTRRGMNNDISEGLKSTMSGLFGITLGSDDEEKENKDKLRSGLTNMVSGAFKGILGENSAGETESQSYFIVPIGFAFYRIDTFMWKWNVTASSGLYSKCQSVTVTVSGCGVLDHTKIKNDELVSFVQQVRGYDAENILDWLEQFQRIMTRIGRLRVKGMEDEAYIQATENAIKSGQYPDKNKDKQKEKARSYRSGMLLASQTPGANDEAYIQMM